MSSEVNHQVETQLGKRNLDLEFLRKTKLSDKMLENYT